MDFFQKILNHLKIHNTVFYHGDGIKGWPANFLFERIIITAVAKSLPSKIIKQMSNGGILVLPLIHDNEQYITKIIKKNNKIYFKKYWKVRFVPLTSGIN